jgi:hypothetical protein
MRAVRVIAMLLVAALAITGCKKKKPPPPAPYVPPPRTALSVSEFSTVCSSGDKYETNDAYQKGTAPSPVAVFQKYVDDPAGIYKEATFAPLKPIDAYSPRRASAVQLVACVESKRQDEPGHCSYTGKELLLYTMRHTVRVVEAKTGREVAKQDFALDHRTARCPTIYNFPSGVSTVFEGTDIGPKLGAVLLPFEPDGTTLAPVKAGKLDDVCAGGAVPEAAKYTPGQPAKVHLVYFADEPQSFSREDLPAGMPPLDELEGDAGGYALVACVTGKPEKKKKSCDYSSGKTLNLHDGQFEAKLFEAQTGKLVDTKSFKGTSPGGCPTLHKFWGSNDRVMTKIDPGFAKWLTGLEGKKR